MLIKSKLTIKNILLGILICLFVIAIKPAPSLEIPNIHIPEHPSEIDVTELNKRALIQLDKNRFAIVNQDDSSYTKILVLEYDEKNKKLNRVSKMNFDFDFEFNFE
ncbi:hypothetical protein [Brevibacillus migulae]|uniref:hypothetical protein n=1 Tax=Brevibacillus migulae TaxID=1644114 RepID=UPI00106DED8E|nr:hypothetical protein [Brevibacillus migulae]